MELDDIIIVDTSELETIKVVDVLSKEKLDDARSINYSFGNGSLPIPWDCAISVTKTEIKVTFHNISLNDVSVPISVSEYLQLLIELGKLEVSKVSFQYGEIASGSDYHWLSVKKDDEILFESDIEDLTISVTDIEEVFFSLLPDDIKELVWNIDDYYTHYCLLEDSEENQQEENDII